MSKLFRVVGVVIIVLSVLFFVLSVSSSILIAFSSIFFATLLGLALIAIGDLLERVDFLEKKLEISYDEDLPQVVCPNCGIEHDFDFLKCPRCKHEHQSL